MLGHTGRMAVTKKVRKCACADKKQCRYGSTSVGDALCFTMARAQRMMNTGRWIQAIKFCDLLFAWSEGNSPNRRSARVDGLLLKAEALQRLADELKPGAGQVGGRTRARHLNQAKDCLWRATALEPSHLAARAAYRQVLQCLSGAPGLRGDLRRRTTRLQARTVRAAALLQARTVWAHVEGTGDLLANVLSRLDHADDLGRAARVCRTWRHAAAEERVWEQICKQSVYLPQLKAAPWCRLSWRELCIQKCRATYARALDDRQHNAVGPRLEHEYFEHCFIRHMESTPREGVVTATRAMLEHNDLYRKVDLCRKVCRLDGDNVIYPPNTGPKKTRVQCAVEDQKCARRYVWRAIAKALGHGSSSWFETPVGQALEYPSIESVTDAVAQCSDARRYFEDLLSASIETLQLEVSLLSSLTVEESSLTYKTQPRSFLLATKKAARIVKDIIKFKQEDVPLTSHFNSFGTIQEFEASRSKPSENFVHPPLEPWMGPGPAARAIEYQLQYTPKPLKQVPKLPTLSLRPNFLLGFEVKHGGSVVFSQLAGLDDARMCRPDHTTLLWEWRAGATDVCEWQRNGLDVSTAH